MKATNTKQQESLSIERDEPPAFSVFCCRDFAFPHDLKTQILPGQCKDVLAECRSEIVLRSKFSDIRDRKETYKQTDATEKITAIGNNDIL